MTTQTIARRDETAALAIRAGQEFWTREQRAALSVLGIKNATNADLAVFMHYCQKTGLDPFSRQIYMICRREKVNDQWVDKQTIQVGIDGFRVIRDRIEQRQGVAVEYEDTIWYDAEGRPYDVWLSEQPPAACRVVVLKNGRRFPAVLRTAAYMATKDGKPVSQWRTQPDHMIEKCAEAFALRRAFPNDLGGVYLEDELPPAEQAAPVRQRVTRAELVGEPEPAEPPSDQGAKREDPTPAQPASGSGSTAAPAPARTARRPSTATIGKLAGTLGQLGPPEDVAAFLAWQTGRADAATAADLTGPEMRIVTSYLGDVLSSVQGDTDEARDRIWAQYRDAAGGKPDGEASDG